MYVYFYIFFTYAKLYISSSHTESTKILDSLYSSVPNIHHSEDLPNNIQVPHRADIRVGQLTLACSCVGVHIRMTFTSSSLKQHQCHAYWVHLISMAFKMRRKWP